MSRRTVYYTRDGAIEGVAALDRGEVIRLRDDIVENLNREMKEAVERRTHYLYSEGLDGRWYRSANVVNSAGDVANVSASCTPTDQELKAIDKLVESADDHLEKWQAEVARLTEDDRA